MTIPGPPYLLEYRVARALMESGNIGPAKLNDMLDRGDAFLFEGDQRDFKSCPLCKGLLGSHPASFLRTAVSDMGVRAAVAGKLIDDGKLTSARAPIAESTIKMVAIASRKGLKCVMFPSGVLWDNFAACDVAQVTVIAVNDFIAAL